MRTVNPLNEQEAKAARSELVLTATAFLREELPFLEGVRKLASARFLVVGAENDPELLLFAAIESQADHIPTDSMRGLCTEGWLEQCDKEERELSSQYQREAIEACERLIQRFVS